MICALLTLLAGLLGGALWLQSAANTPQISTNFPSPVPPVPLRFGFYDLSGSRSDDDPVLAAMAKEKLDFLILENVADSERVDVEKRSGFFGPGTYAFPPQRQNLLPSATREKFNCICARYPLKSQGLELHAPDTAVVSATVAGREFVLISGGTLEQGQSNQVIEQSLQRLPAVACMNVASRQPGDDLLQRGSGLFDAGAVFWRLPIGSPEVPPANHILFSAGWSCTGGKAVQDPHDPQHRIGWIITTAGAAPAATQAAGEGEE